MKRILLILSIVMITFSSCSIDGNPLIEPTVLKGEWQRNVMTGSGYDKEGIETIILLKDNSFSLKVNIKGTPIYTDTLTGLYKIIDGKEIKLKPLFINGNHYKNMGVHRINEEIIQSFSKKENQIIISKVKYTKSK